MDAEMIDILLKEWTKSQQLPVSSMTRFRVRIIYDGEFYGALDIDKDIVIYPDDLDRNIIHLSASRLNGCSELQPKGINLNPRHGFQKYNVLFKTVEERDKALSDILKLIESDSTDSSSSSLIGLEITDLF